MAVIGKSLAAQLILMCLAACSHHSTSIRQGVSVDEINCKPTSTDLKVLAGSQAGCHTAIAGTGFQVLDNSVHRRPSMSSDTTRRESTSVFVSSDVSSTFTGPLQFNAFYSRGLFDLRGKSGCVGVLESGSAAIEEERGRRTLRYDLNFRLVSPHGWKDDCAAAHHVTGSARLDH